MADYYFNKHFTIEEARSYLPILKPLLQEMRLLAIKLSEAGFDIYKAKYKPGFHPGTQREFPPEFERVVELIRLINREGIEVKSVEQGMVDFPALRGNKEEVFLCWKLDEDDIEFWHPLQGGYRAREHIDDF